jgi:hypothetical protein
MPVNDPLSRIVSLYHFTDRRNLRSIRELGGLHPRNALTQKGATIPAPGGNQWSWDADDRSGLGAYVHLCFRANHPMEYLARQDGRIGDTIFLEIHPDVLRWEGVMFSPDVSNKSGVPIYPISQAIPLIDFEVICTRTDWRDSGIRHRLQQAEKCEILVPRVVPLELIRNLPSG